MQCPALSFVFIRHDLRRRRDLQIKPRTLWLHL